MRPLEAERDALIAEVTRLKAINAHLAAAIQTPLNGRKTLHEFLDAAAGEGLVLRDIDAADLYMLLFPAEYAMQVESLECKPRFRP